MNSASPSVSASRSGASAMAWCRPKYFSCAACTAGVSMSCMKRVAIIPWCTDPARTVRAIGSGLVLRGELLGSARENADIGSDRDEPAAQLKIAANKRVVTGENSRWPAAGANARNGFLDHREHIGMRQVSDV